ncbi:MAG: GYF domain-containing protein [Pseudomonadota bacterium]
MVDPAEDVQYWWLAADGARLSGSGRDLRAALRGGALRSATLVWRSGWAEWLPADRVPELAEAIAEATAAPSSFGTLGPPRRSPTKRPSSGPPPPPSRARAPMPTLSEEQGVAPATATLRPPGAVPPPARGVPVPALDSSPRAIVTPIPSFGPPGGKVETPLPLALPAVVNRALLADAKTPSIEPPLDSTLESVPHVPAEARRTPVPPLPAARDALTSSVDAEGPERPARQDSLVKLGRIGLDSRTVVMALSALSGALLVALLALTLSRSQSKSPTAEERPRASAQAPSAPPPVPGCRLALPAARIAASVERGVPAYAAKVEKVGDLALGIAESKTKGLGLRVDPNTLDVSSVFEEEGKDAVRGVVPLARSGSLTFFVDRDDRALRSAHTIDEIPPFTLGVSDAGFSRVVAGSASLVWQLDASAKITEPRSAQLADYGYGVTFRRGGQSGAVMLGFIANDGEKKSELAQVPGAPKFVGTPVIAGSGAGALIAFAGRDAADAPWKLFVSQALPGAPPSPARELVSGSGGGAISPTLAALSGDRWLVQWTEGSSAQYHVHVQSFAADLSAIGKSVAVSPKGANAGQGALATFAGGAITLFILTTAGHDELWGATLACQ